MMTCDYDEKNAQEYCVNDSLNRDHHENVKRIDDNNNNSNITSETEEIHETSETNQINQLVYVMGNHQSNETIRQINITNNKNNSSSSDPYLKKRRIAFGTRTKPIETTTHTSKRNRIQVVINDNATNNNGMNNNNRNENIDNNHLVRNIKVLSDERHHHQHQQEHNDKHKSSFDWQQKSMHENPFTTSPSWLPVRSFNRKPMMGTAPSSSVSVSMASLSTTRKPLTEWTTKATTKATTTSTISIDKLSLPSTTTTIKPYVPFKFMTERPQLPYSNGRININVNPNGNVGYITRQNPGSFKPISRPILSTYHNGNNQDEINKPYSLYQTRSPGLIRETSSKINLKNRDHHNDKDNISVNNKSHQQQQQQIKKQKISNPLNEYSPYIPSEFTANHFPGPGFFDDRKFFQNLDVQESSNSKSKVRNNINEQLNEPSTSTYTTLTEMVSGIINQIPQQDKLIQSESEIKVYADSNDQPKLDYENDKEIQEESLQNNENAQNLTEISLVSIPVLIPTGISRSYLREKMLSSHLKPTTVPFADQGQEFPAYILEFDVENSDPQTNYYKRKKSKRKNKSKIRVKRQSFPPYSFENPFLTPFSSSNYFPIFSAANSEFDNYFNNIPFRSSLFHVQTPIRINSIKPNHGPAPAIMKLSHNEQQHVPQYILPKQLLASPEIHFESGPFELNDFDEINSVPFEKIVKRPLEDKYETVTYRPVKIRRPGFKRPPNRYRIPGYQGEKERKYFRKATSINDNADTISTANQLNLPVKASFKVKNHLQSLDQNQNPQTTNPFSNTESSLPPRNLEDAIRLFDDPSSPFLPFGPSFDPQTLLHLNPPDDFFDSKPQQADRKPVASALTETNQNTDANKIKGTNSNVEKNLQNNNNNNNNNNSQQKNRLSSQFAGFDLPDLAIPNIDISGLQNFVSNFSPQLFGSTATTSNSQANNSDIQSLTSHNQGVAHFDPFNQFYQSPDRYQGSKGKGVKNSNDDSRNNNNNKEILSSAKTTLELLAARDRWQGISSYKSGTTTEMPIEFIENHKLNDGGDGDGDMKYGVRLKGSQSISVNKVRSPVISVKTSVSAVSSINPAITMQRPSQTIYQAESNQSDEKLEKEESKIQDENEKENFVDKIKVNAHTDRDVLLKYYNAISDNKNLMYPTTTSTTTTTTTKSPTTYYWLWKSSANDATSTTTTTTESTTKSESRRAIKESPSDIMTTTLPSTLSLYKKVFSALQSGSFQNKHQINVPKLFGIKPKPNFVEYLSSLTTTTQTPDTN